MNTSDIKYISLLAPLFYLYGTIFLWAKNIHMFTLEQIAYSSVCVFTVAIILYVAVYLLLKIINRKLAYSKKVQAGVALYVAVLVGLIGNFCFLKVIFIPYHHIVMYGIMIFIFLCIFYNLTPKMVLFFSVLLLFTIIQFSYNTYNIYRLTQMTTRELAKANNDELYIKFKDKPNIYLFWLESFHGTRTLKNVYLADITYLIGYLNNHNFSICENMYSSSSATLRSMSDTYSLGYFDYHNVEIGNLDALDVVRNLIGGDTGNNLLKTLKYNDYKTNIIVDDYNYYFHKNGQYLDFSTLDYWNSTFYSLIPFYCFTKWNNKIEMLGRPDSLGTLKEQIEHEIKKMQKENSPYFLAWKGGVFHTPSDGTYTYKDKTEWLKSEVYKKAVEQDVSHETQEIISMILEKDSNALIIMLGDHGSWVYRGLEINELSKENITITDFIDDKFNVFSAVRLPEKYGKFSFDSGDTYINHMNIFIHIFSLLAQNPAYLELQKIPVSNHKGKVVVTNGIINEKVIEE